MEKNQMKCLICNHTVSAHNKGDACVCFACRGSHQMTPITLFRTEDGDMRLSLDPETDVLSEATIVERIPAELPKSDLALLRDLEHRANFLPGGPDEALELLVWDRIPTMVAKALAAKK